MKTLILITGMLAVSFTASAKEKARKPSEARGDSAPANFTVRCEGLNKKGVKIGLDAELDPVERLVSLTSFEAESTAVIATHDLGAPSQFVLTDSKGVLQIFGFKSFNDGLEEVMKVHFVAGNPRLSGLKLGTGENNLAVRNIGCRILK